jgi:hypothetical protein
VGFKSALKGALITLLNGPVYLSQHKKMAAVIPLFLLFIGQVIIRAEINPDNIPGQSK